MEGHGGARQVEVVAPLKQIIIITKFVTPSMGLWVPQSDAKKTIYHQIGIGSLAIWGLHIVLVFEIAQSSAGH